MKSCAKSKGKVRISIKSRSLRQMFQTGKKSDNCNVCHWCLLLSMFFFGWQMHYWLHLFYIAMSKFAWSLINIWQVAPPGLNSVQTMACGACSVEQGLKAIFIKYMVKNLTYDTTCRLHCQYLSHTKQYLYSFSKAKAKMRFIFVSLRRSVDFCKVYSTWILLFSMSHRGPHKMHLKGDEGPCLNLAKAASRILLMNTNIYTV